MRNTIIQKLRDIASENRIRILFANESGSRAWGFPSPDSDYDVRFIYLRPRDYYLSIAERKDQLAFPINDELDIYGWDIRKVLQLILKSNTTTFEWLQSPIIYREEPGFRESLWALCGQYFSRRSNAHHFLGIARGAMEGMSPEGDIKIKKLFYILRPLLSAKWCLERNSIAPMTIDPLMELLPESIRTIVRALIVQKADAAEGFVIRPDEALRDFIDAEYRRLEEAASGLERDSFSIEPLDEYFRDIIKQYEHTGA